MKPYKFVSWDIPALNSLENTPTWALWYKLENGQKLTREEKNRAYGKCHKLLGWCFPLSGLRRYIVNLRCYGWREVYAYDKTSVRANNTGVLEIIEAPQK